MSNLLRSIVEAGALHVRFELILAVLAALLPVVAETAQTPSDSQVVPASLNRADSRPAAGKVRFARRASRVGDVIEQDVHHEMKMSVVWRQGNQIVNNTAAASDSNQRRTITTTRVDQGRATAVRISYMDATKTRSASDAADSSPQTMPQPTHGKTYLCLRDGEKLVVTDEEGRVPPPEELDQVSGDLNVIGRPSPLVEFLAGRTVNVGETLSLPLKEADRVLGLRAEFGKFTRFDLTLRELRVEQIATCAVFDARIDAASNDSSQMHLQLSGPMFVAIDSCRVISNKLSGPIALSESRGSYSAAVQLISTGRIALHVTSQYRDAAP